ncbi:hypothetical protein HY745_00415 [Candidatus Desantisbacteria bacterium]|nr:hypothetical protein [Candidatus Desantisbacteria bacterium]
MKLQNIIALSFILLFIVYICEISAKDTIEVYPKSESSLNFSNAPDAKINKGEFIFDVSHSSLDFVDVMVSIENTDKVWRFNKVKLSLNAKDDKYHSENLSVIWEGINKENKPVIGGQYNIKILIVDTKDNSVEDSSSYFIIDNEPPDIREVVIIPDENNAIRIECQIIDDSKIEKVNYQFNNKVGQKEDFILQSNPTKNEEYFTVISSDKLFDITPFESYIIAKDKVGNHSTAKLILTLIPELVISTEKDKLLIKGDTLLSQLKLEGKYVNGNLKININDSKENVYDLEGKNWIKKIEFKNITNNKTIIPAVFENGQWEADLKGFLKQGENRIQYIYTDFFNKSTVKDLPIITYDIALAKIYKISILDTGIFLVEMNEKVKIIINKTSFEIDLIKSDGTKTIYPADVRLINNDTNIEITPGIGFRNKVVKDDKVIIKIFNISDILDNITDKIESDTFIYNR